MPVKFIDILGIRFMNGDVHDAIQLLDNGGVMVVPAAPALATIDMDPDYHQALKDSDFAIFDSGFLVLLLYLFRGIRVKKISGLLFLREFLSPSHNIIAKDLFLIDPNNEDSEANNRFLNTQGFHIESASQYIAPMYEADVLDTQLLNELNYRRPKYVLINLGGGVQEKLAVFLKKNLAYSPGIICTGAAIAFLTGRQANIPTLADRVYLGWMFRCISSPTRFIPRYLSGFRLIPVLFSHRDKS
jgi:UDP-N-acetyl-D-mannosaminuronic acid transferase (WecB/TagA/CpsF family)